MQPAHLDAATFGDVDRDAGGRDAGQRAAARGGGSGRAHRRARTSRAWSTRSSSSSSASIARLTGGLRVYTTLDTDVQKFAEDVGRQAAGRAGQEAASAAGRHRCRQRSSRSKPSTGYVRALVGGRNFAESSLQSRDRRQAPARVGLQAVRLRGRARSRLLAGHHHRRPRRLRRPRRRAATCPAASTKSNRRRCDRRWCIRAIAPPCTCCSASVSAPPSIWPIASVSIRCPRCRRWRSAPAR